MAGNVLHVIPISHFCEKGRWAMDLSGLPYEERPIVPGVHTVILRRRGSQTVPVLDTDGGTVLGSDAITRFADAHAQLGLYPQEQLLRREVEALIRDFDEHLGPDVRVWVYHSACQDADLYAKLLTQGYGRLGKDVVRRLRRPLMALTKNHFGVSDARYAQAVERIESTLEAADARRGGGTYLVGDRFTAADMAFAALSAPLFFVRGYGVDTPPEEELPADFLASIKAWRSTPSAKVVQTIYDRHRVPARAAVA